MSRAERCGVEPVEAHARAVGGDGEDLGAVAAVDLGGVDVGAALEQIGVVARVPDHAVVAGFAEHLVVGVAAGERVVAGAAEQEVEAASAEEGVVVALTEEHGRLPEPPVRVSLPAPPNRLARGQRPVGFVERDGVVAAQAEHLDQAGIGDRRRAAQDGHGAAVDENVAGRVAAGRDRVVEVVAERRQQPVAG